MRRRQAGELLGVIFGVLLNLILPDIFIIAILAVILSSNSVKTLKKGREWWNKESKERERAAERVTPRPTIRLLCLNGTGP
jgi:uncharacterized membrane protein YfcA